MSYSDYATLEAVRLRVQDGIQAFSFGTERADRDLVLQVGDSAHPFQSHRFLVHNGSSYKEVLRLTRDGFEVGQLQINGGQGGLKSTDGAVVIGRIDLTHYVQNDSTYAGQMVVVLNHGMGELDTLEALTVTPEAASFHIPTVNARKLAVSSSVTSAELTITGTARSGNVMASFTHALAHDAHPVEIVLDSVDDASQPGAIALVAPVVRSGSVQADGVTARDANVETMHADKARVGSVLSIGPSWTISAESVGDTNELAIRGFGSLEIETDVVHAGDRTTVNELVAETGAVVRGGLVVSTPGQQASSCTHAPRTYIEAGSARVVRASSGETEFHVPTMCVSRIRPLTDSCLRDDRYGSLVVEAGAVELRDGVDDRVLASLTADASGGVVRLCGNAGTELLRVSTTEFRLPGVQLTEDDERVLHIDARLAATSGIDTTVLRGEHVLAQDLEVEGRACFDDTIRVGRGGVHNRGAYVLENDARISTDGGTGLRVASAEGGSRIDVAPNTVSLHAGDGIDLATCGNVDVSAEKLLVTGACSFGGPFHVESNMNTQALSVGGELHVPHLDGVEVIQARNGALGIFVTDSSCSRPTLIVDERGISVCGNVQSGGIDMQGAMLYPTDDGFVGIRGKGGRDAGVAVEGTCSRFTSRVLPGEFDIVDVASSAVVSKMAYDEDARALCIDSNTLLIRGVAVATSVRSSDVRTQRVHLSSADGSLGTSLLSTTDEEGAYGRGLAIGAPAVTITHPEYELQPASIRIADTDASLHINIGGGEALVVEGDAYGTSANLSARGSLSVARRVYAPEVCTTTITSASSEDDGEQHVAIEAHTTVHSLTTSGDVFSSAVSAKDVQAVEVRAETASVSSSVHVGSLLTCCGDIRVGGTLTANRLVADDDVDDGLALKARRHVTTRAGEGGVLAVHSSGEVELAGNLVALGDVFSASTADGSSFVLTSDALHTDNISCATLHIAREVVASNASNTVNIVGALRVQDSARIASCMDVGTCLVVGGAMHIDSAVIYTDDAELVLAAEDTIRLDARTVTTRGDVVLGEEGVTHHARLTVVCGDSDRGSLNNTAAEFASHVGSCRVVVASRPGFEKTVCFEDVGYGCGDDDGYEQWAVGVRDGAAVDAGGALGFFATARSTTPDVLLLKDGGGGMKINVGLSVAGDVLAGSNAEVHGTASIGGDLTVNASVECVSFLHVHDGGDDAQTRRSISLSLGASSSLITATGGLHIASGEGLVMLNGNTLSIGSGQVRVNGSAIVGGELDMTNHKVTNLASPVEASDAVNKLTLDQALADLYSTENVFPAPIYFVSSPEGAALRDFGIGFRLADAAGSGNRLDFLIGGDTHDGVSFSTSSGVEAVHISSATQRLTASEYVHAKAGIIIGADEAHELKIAHTEGRMVLGNSLDCRPETGDVRVLGSMGIGSFSSEPQHPMHVVGDAAEDVIVGQTNATRARMVIESDASSGAQSMALYRHSASDLAFSTGYESSADAFVVASSADLLSNTHLIIYRTGGEAILGASLRLRRPGGLDASLRFEDSVTGAKQGAVSAYTLDFSASSISQLSIGGVVDASAAIRVSHKLGGVEIMNVRSAGISVAGRVWADTIQLSGDATLGMDESGVLLNVDRTLDAAQGVQADWLATTSVLGFNAYTDSSKDIRFVDNGHAAVLARGENAGGDPVIDFLFSEFTNTDGRGELFTSQDVPALRIGRDSVAVGTHDLSTGSALHVRKDDGPQVHLTRGVYDATMEVDSTGGMTITSSSRAYEFGGRVQCETMRATEEILIGSWKLAIGSGGELVFSHAVGGGAYEVKQVMTA